MTGQGAPIKVTLLGTGPAGGVPMLSAGWGDCDPDEPRNRRLRASILVEQSGRRLLVDSGPDVREQLLAVGVPGLDGVLYTHAHADHIHGIDELREVNRLIRGPLPIWGDEPTLHDLQQRFSYCFEGIDLATQPIFRPWLVPNLIQPRFTAVGVAVRAFAQDHGWATSWGFRIGNFAYSTDVLDLDEAAFAVLDGVTTWVVGCLTNTPHSTHAHVDKVIGWHQRVRPERTVLTHMGPSLDYGTLRRTLPEGLEPGYDGMVLEVA
ncbi:Metal-dependent hydrolase [Caenispirillum salinarum AK4]|uniref:Metal-dependent hydrolase n=1 Tax=Caenispirillum salinarum AK4 TaxID=1238182 RepID=K9H376_9PROT|nr:MBL fold metallo-hydrolase [Caenispirillum salinarum]EKV31509.1 Metal-dependent hydrolase [Caenispirillum salinarum AK4]